jgi:hypothetical protein
MPQQANVRRLLEEPVAAEALHRAEVGLALHVQPDIAMHDVAGIHTSHDGQVFVDSLEHRRQPLQVIALQRRPSYALARA